VIACLTCTETDRPAARVRRARPRATGLHLARERTGGAAPPPMVR
jgi:hypothetical protein